MDLREKLSKDVNLILDPVSLGMPPKQFIADFGGNIDRISVLAKYNTGHVFYESSVAPLHPNVGKFFSEISQVAEGLIDVYAVVNTLSDSYMAQDFKYASVKSGGRKSETHICPTKDETLSYLGDVVKEVIKYPIKGIVFTGNTFVNRYHCFCENCRQEFKVVSSLPSEYDYNRLKVENELLDRWASWKADKINSMISYLNDLVKQEDDSLEVIFEVYLDPTVNYNENAKIEYGQDIPEISRSYHTAININPWSPILPEPDSNEYSELIKALSFTRDLKRIGKSFDLLYWSIDEENDYDILKKIKNDIGAKGIYAYSDYPINYTDLRETHLGR